MTGEKKNPVGRPRTGKRKIIIVLDPETIRIIDAGARKAGLNRSAYIEICFRNAKLPKFG